MRCANTVAAARACRRGSCKAAVRALVIRLVAARRGGGADCRLRVCSIWGRFAQQGRSCRVDHGQAVAACGAVRGNNRNVANLAVGGDASLAIPVHACPRRLHGTDSAHQALCRDVCRDCVQTLQSESLCAAHQPGKHAGQARMQAHLVCSTDQIVRLLHAHIPLCCAQDIQHDAAEPQCRQIKHQCVSNAQRFGYHAMQATNGEDKAMNSAAMHTHAARAIRSNNAGCRMPRCSKLYTFHGYITLILAINELLSLTARKQGRPGHARTWHQQSALWRQAANLAQHGDAAQIVMPHMPRWCSVQNYAAEAQLR